MKAAAVTIPHSQKLFFALIRDMGLRDIKGFRGGIYRLEQLEARTAFAARGLMDFLRLRERQNGDRPQVTVAVVGRNDDYMSDFAERLRATTAWNAKYLASEIIFVEWNPPADRELLSIDLAKRFPSLRAYVVSREVHKSIAGDARLPLLEFHAKNVGIRRARSEWVLTTNADAFFGPDTIRKLQTSKLADTIVWCAQRIDIPWREGRRVKQSSRLSSLPRSRRITLSAPEICPGQQTDVGTRRRYDSHCASRIGLDRGGVAHMIAHGARTERAGIVLHLAHPTSNTEGVGDQHGRLADWETDLPYQNDPGWGLANHEEEEIADRVWLIK